MKKKFLRLLILSLSFAVLAIASFCYLESYRQIRIDGVYHYTQSGELRFRGGRGLSVTDMIQWSPTACWWQPGYLDITGRRVTRGNFAGYLYSPLIAVDRRHNFPDRRIFSIDELIN